MPRKRSRLRAVDALRAALVESPDNLGLREHFAASLALMGEQASALAEYRRILAVDPSRVSTLLVIAELFLDLGHHGEALVIAEDLIAKSLEEATARLLRARAFHEMGKTAEAIHDYLLAIREDPLLADEDLAEDLGLGERKHDRDGVPDSLVTYLLDRFELPKVTFADAPWLARITKKLRDHFLDPAQPPAERVFSSGALLYGPAGCGKEEAARCLAGEMQARLVVIPVAELLGMWPADAGERLFEVFDTVRSHRPAVVLFQQIEALGAPFTDMHDEDAQRLVKRFTQLLQGRRGENRGVAVLASTDDPWRVDPWLRQPDLFHRLIFTPPPGLEERERLWQRLCRKHPIGELKWHKLARHSEGCSGADIRGVIDLVVATNWAGAMQTGIPTVVRTRDMLRALEKCRRSVPSWLATARHYLRFDRDRQAYVGVKNWLARESADDAARGD